MRVLLGSSLPISYFRNDVLQGGKNIVTYIWFSFQCPAIGGCSQLIKIKDSCTKAHKMPMITMVAISLLGGGLNFVIIIPTIKTLNDLPISIIIPANYTRDQN